MLLIIILNGIYGGSGCNALNDDFGGGEFESRFVLVFFLHHGTDIISWDCRTNLKFLCLENCKLYCFRAILNQIQLNKLYIWLVPWTFSHLFFSSTTRRWGRRKELGMRLTSNLLCFAAEEQIFTFLQIIHEFFVSKSGSVTTHGKKYVCERVCVCAQVWDCAR